MPRASYSWMIYLRIYLSRSRLPVFVLPNFNKHISNKNMRREEFLFSKVCPDNIAILFLPENNPFITFFLQIQ